MTRTPRTATVIADGRATLLEIRWQGLRDLMRRTPAIREHVERLYRENSLRVHLRETPLLRDLPAEQLDEVAAATVFESYGNSIGTPTSGHSRRRDAAEQIAAEPLIAAEGDRPTGLLLDSLGLRSRQPAARHGHRTLAYLGKGRCSARGVGRVVQKRRGRAVAAFAAGGGVCRCAADSDGRRARRDSAELQIADCGSTDCRLADHRSIRNPKSEIRSVDSQLLEFLADHRFLNGTQTMLIDLDRCTRCDDCVRACAATHDNNPRFIRQGPKHDHIMVANACMHCVDPVCMIGCPTGAIARDAETGTVRINDRTCIGCSTCANSCPYRRFGWSRFASRAERFSSTRRRSSRS